MVPHQARKLGVLPGLLVAIAVFGTLSACGGSGSGDGGSGSGSSGGSGGGSKSSTRPTPAKTAKPTSPAAMGDAAKDVEITKCEGSTPAAAGVRATVRIHNSTAEPWGYSGTVRFTDPSGKQIAEGLFAKNRIAAGATAVAADIPGDTFDQHSKVSCSVADVRRNPPK